MDHLKKPFFCPGALTSPPDPEISPVATLSRIRSRYEVRKRGLGAVVPSSRRRRSERWSDGHTDRLRRGGGGRGGGPSQQWKCMEMCCATIFGAIHNLGKDPISPIFPSPTVYPWSYFVWSETARTPTRINPWWIPVFTLQGTWVSLGLWCSFRTIGDCTVGTWICWGVPSCKA